MLGAAGLWICGVLAILMAEGHAGVWVYISSICFLAGFLVGVLGALIFMFYLIKFLITKNPRVIE